MNISKKKTTSHGLAQFKNKDRGGYALTQLSASQAQLIGGGGRTPTRPPPSEGAGGKTH